MTPANYIVPHYTQFVIKISKQCNLRCNYCYEYPYLADRTRMSLQQIENLFLNVASYYSSAPHIKVLDFIWHGGEPLLIEPEYYFSIKELQKKIFDTEKITVSNKVQTNLTALTGNYIRAFKQGLFDSIGVSLDLFGNDRVNIAKKPVQEKVLTNMQRLVDENIRFGCITVLSKKTFQHVESIYEFFDEIDVPCRFLPIYRTGYAGQHDLNMLTTHEVIVALKRVFEAWISSHNAVEVDPIDNYINIALRILNASTQAKEFYDKKFSDTVFIVNTNGDVYSTDEVYTSDLSYGNLFTTSFHDILNSDGYHRAINRSRHRVESTCGTCKYYGSCNGYEMAEATNEILYFNKAGHLDCGVVKPMVSYIVRRLKEEGIAEALSFRGGKRGKCKNKLSNVA